MFLAVFLYGDEDGKILGRLIAVQIKSGESWFREWSKEHVWWVFRSDRKHLGYWLNHVLPVIVVVYDPASDEAYWQLIAEHTIRRRTDAGFVLAIPKDQPFTVAARDALMAVSWRRDETALADFETNLQHLPGSAVASLMDARGVDRLGAALLADMLTNGRREPALTAMAAIGGQPLWLTSSPAAGGLWEALAGYLDEHECQPQAAEAFLRGAEMGGAKEARRRAFAGLSLIAAGDRGGARTMLEQAASGGAGMLADVGLAALDRSTDDGHPVQLPASVSAATDSQLDAEPLAPPTLTG